MKNKLLFFQSETRCKQMNWMMQYTYTWFTLITRVHIVSVLKG